MKDLLIITRVDDIRNLPTILKNWEVINGYGGFDLPKITYEIVLNLDKVDLVPSQLIKRCAKDSIFLNFNFDGPNTIAQIVKSNPEYRYFYICDETTVITSEFFINMRLVLKRKEDFDLIVFDQQREGTLEVAHALDWSLQGKESAVGILDYGQVVFGKVITTFPFSNPEPLSGELVDEVVRKSGKDNILTVNSMVNYRNILQQPTKGARPKMGITYIEELPVDYTGKVELIRNALETEDAASYMKHPYNKQLTEEDNYHTALNESLYKEDYLNAPKISLFTSAYNIGDRILQTYESIAAQTLDNWEWVIVNDSLDGGETQKVLEQLTTLDDRVRVYQFSKPTRGNIGEAKFRAASLCRGPLLAEMDHDDLLLPTCLETIVKAHEQHPECGFLYTECCEVGPDYNSNPRYPEGFALGYGSYKVAEYEGMKFDVVNILPINPLTIRHIVGVPNHMRVWTSEVYHKIAGHNEEMRIADDFELIVRTFLVTRFCEIKKMLYIQRFDGKNSQDNGNREDIQRRVKEISKYYWKRVCQRFHQLGVTDFADAEIEKVPELWFIPARDGYNVQETYKEL